MSTNVVNQVAYLRTSRHYPEDLHQLTVEVNKSYVDIANAINSRTIGIFPTDISAITGESFFISNQRQQTFRQVYTFKTIAIGVVHGITNFANIPFFTKMYGQFTDGTNWYGLEASSTVPTAGQITFWLSPTNIVFNIGAGAPVLTSGIIVLEWMSNI